MDLINGLLQLLQNPKEFIAAWIAMGPLAAYGFIFLIIFVETGVVFMPFLPGDSLLFAAGFFASVGSLDIFLLLAIVWIAAIVGDQCNFFIGHYLGQRIVASGKVKAMTPERLKESEKFMEKWGGLSILLGRFFPFIRTFVPFLAGMGGMKWHSFFMYNVIGGIAWSSIFTLLGFFFGGIPFVQEHFELVVIGIIAVSVVPAVVGAVKMYHSGKKGGEDVVGDTSELADAQPSDN